MIIGLTGGTGTGKTTISQFFAEAGFEVIDYDKVTREVYTKGSECLDEIIDTFGKCILDDDGNLNRKALGEIVFADKALLDTLNKIVYKYILDYTRDTIANSEDGLLLLDAPTLFESGLNIECDSIVGVVAKKDLKVKRVTQRDNLEAERVEDRINSQKSDEFFYENCDFIIVNNGSLADLEIQVKDIINKLNI